MTFSWISLALALLKIAHFLLSKSRESGLILEGEDRAIAEQTRQIYLLTMASKKRMEEIDAMSDEDVDRALLDLESRRVRDGKKPE